MNINLRSKIKRIINERQLSSLMNNTKWKELCYAMINEMPFLPPFAIKYLDNPETPTLIENSNYSSIWHELGRIGKPFSFIEYILVRPKRIISTHIYTSKEILDATNVFLRLLKKYNIPYEEKNEIFIVYGYK